MSADHSLVAEMVRSGRLTKAEAKTYPGRNLITRAVGVDSSVEADVYEIKMHEGQDAASVFGRSERSGDGRRDRGGCLAGADDGTGVHAID